MNTIAFELKLLADAEPGSGTGNEILNDVLARDHDNRVVIRGSHLRGLLREQLICLFGEHTDVESYLFGEEGNRVRSGALRVPDTPAPAGAVVRMVTRTALEAHGTVKPGSLRSTEAVAAGTVFKGRIQLDAALDSAPALCILAALLSLEAVGGGRTRGCGACLVTLPEQEETLPGDLFARAMLALADWKPPPSAQLTLASQSPLDGDQPVWLQLFFTAEEPVCCPEIPVLGNNVIQSGISIPASAVLGAVIGLLDREDSTLASQTLLSPLTRAWPLNPVPENDTACGMPVRVSLSHRMSKLPDKDGTYDFRDAAVLPYSRHELREASPLKGSDGILFHRNGKTQLWKSAEIPRMLTSHAVHRNESNLFTVESLAPQLFRGLLCLPSAAKPVLETALGRVNAQVVLGKARGVRGGGRLALREVSPSELFSACRTDVWVLQSPMALPDPERLGSSRAETVMGRLLETAGWPKLRPLSGTQGELAVRTMANAGIRFGWNRHGAGTIVEGSRRLRACQVFLPGSVFVLEEKIPAADLEQALLRGSGVLDGNDRLGRMRGYGAVLPHPGIAEEKYSPPTTPPAPLPFSVAGEWAWKWFEACRQAPPSTSQISAVAELLPDRNKALEFLNRQKQDRSLRVWERWAPVFDPVCNAVNKDPSAAREALRTWRDLSILYRKEKV